MEENLMRKPYRFAILTVLLILLTACGGTVLEPTLDVNLAHTQAAQTVIAVLTQVATDTAQAPAEATATTQPELQATATDTSMPPTNTPAPSDTPAVTATGEPCVDRAEFVNDVTIPDNTVFLPGESFVKTWRLKNAGTCTWTTSYGLVLASGDQMGAASPTNLPAEVKPGQEADLSVQFKSPGTPGTYRSDWALSNASNQRIGLKDKPEATFWVQIVVQEGTDSLNLGNPDWKDPMDNSNSWYDLSTDNTEWEFDDGHLRMRSKSTDKPEEWGLSSKAAMSDYFLQATFKTGDTCGGLDRYGVLVRAPDPSMGYVFEFSCDGRYRLYIWDGEDYVALQEWKSSGFIAGGPDQTNVLGIWLQGETIKLYANGKLLSEFENDKFDEGRFGLVIGADQTEGFEAFVEEVAYWILED
jgi:hypothetical protein